ncbi:MAG: hypothetical protein L3J14_08695 [Flavobacteriaceae bacterium]|nr:hypothetical protein [Flavobacteriaceae bacterium]
MSTFSSAQLGFENRYTKATIYFKNGGSTHGFARFIGNKIKFKKDKKSKRVTYGANKLTKIYISRNRKGYEYHYKFIKG